MLKAHIAAGVYEFSTAKDAANGKECVASGNLVGAP